MIVKEFEIKAIYLPNAIKMFFVQKFDIQYNIYHVLTAPVSIALISQNFKHEIIVVLLSFSCAKLEFTW